MNFQKTVIPQEKWKTFRTVKTKTFSEFQDICSNDVSRNEMREYIIAGDIFIIKKVMDGSIIRDILKKVISSNAVPVLSTRIVEGIKNIHFTSNNLKNTIGEYSSIDNSWYFFPWNPDAHGILAAFQSIFDTVIQLNNYSPEQLKNNTPLNGVVQRMHLIHYPPDSGEISLHYDPCNIVKVNSGIYFSEFGKDYDEGGFYVLDGNKQKVNLDKEVSIGDLVLFYPSLAHGVGPVKIKNINESTSCLYPPGRYFFNMTLVESHEKVDRERAVGI